MKNIFVKTSLATCYFLLATKFAAAASGNGVTVGVPVNGNTNFAGFNSYVSAILKYSIRLGFALAVLMIIYSGIKYMTSQGNQTQINDAKEIIMGAIIGFAMLLLIDVILRFLGVPIN